MNEERDSIRLLVSQSLMALCRSQLDYKQELSVDALVAITIDRKEVIVINVKDSLDFNSPSIVIQSCMKSPEYYAPESPKNPSPLRNESASDLDDNIFENHYINKNHDLVETNDGIEANDGIETNYGIVTNEECTENNFDDIHKNQNHSVRRYNYLENSFNDTPQNQHNLQTNAALLTVIAPRDSINDEEDLLGLDNSDGRMVEEVLEENEESSGDAGLKIASQDRNETNSFQKISLKSYSPTHIRNRIRLKINKNINNTSNNNNVLNHEISFSNGTLNKKIILNSSLDSSHLINNDNNTYPRTNIVATSGASNNTNQTLTCCTSSGINNSTRSALVTKTENYKVLSMASANTGKTKELHRGNMAWEDFQGMLIKNLRRNHQEELDVKPQLMHYIQSWSGTTDSNSHKRLKECMQSILLYEGKYVPVRDIQRLRLSGMTSQEIRSSMEFLNSMREGRIGCYREIRGCIGVFYKCPPHLIDIQWLAMFGLNQHMYALKFNSQMPLNATNRHSVVYWNRIHSSSPYINASLNTS